MTAQSLQSYHTQLVDLLAPLADAEARDTGFLKRESKLSGLLFVLTLVSCFWSRSPRSLACYVQRAASLQPGLTLAPQSFDERFTQAAVALLTRVLAAVLHLRVQTEALAVPCLSSFPALYLLDSSTFALPEALKTEYRGSGGAASAAAAKCFWLLEWFTASTQQILVRDGVKADQNMGTSMLAGTRPAALWLFDLGFWSITFLASIAQYGSFFVSRLHGAVTVRTPEGEPFDLMAWLRASVEDVTECRITLGIKERLACRVIAERVPSAVAAQRRRKCKEGARRRGRALRAETLERLDWSVWVTNVPETVLTAKQVKAVYRIRWQIELLFKLAKSTAGLKVFTSEKKERIECELYAGLIALVLAEHLGALARPRGEQISAVKLWNALREKVLPWCRALMKRMGDRSLRELIAWIARHAQPTKRKRQPSTYSLIKNLEPGPPLAAARAP
jgi:hypothetical protein